MVTIMIFFGILNYNLKDFMAAHKLYYLSWILRGKNGIRSDVKKEVLFRILLLLFVVWCLVIYILRKYEKRHITKTTVFKAIK